MTHRPTVGSWGNADDLRSQADLLDGIEDSMAGVYAEKTGLDKDKAKAKFMGNGDLWMTAEMALKAKLVDALVDGIAAEIPATASTEKELWDAFSIKLQLKPQSDMKQIALSLDQLAALNLTPQATLLEISAAVDSAITRYNVAAQQLASEKQKVTTLQTEVDGLKETANKDAITGLIEAALKGKKISKAVSMTLAKDYATNPTGLKALLDGMGTYVSITETLENGDGANAAEVAQLVTMKYEDLDKKGLLMRLRELSEDAFQAKYKTKFGKTYDTK